MDADLRRASPLWILVLLAVPTLTEGRSVRRPQEDAHASGRTSSHVQPHLLPALTREHDRPRPVTVECHPDSLEVVVQADMFAAGLLVDGRHLRLGSDPLSEGSACGAAASGEAQFTIRAHLMDCGTKLSSTEEKIIYSNVLIYSPEPSSGGLLRLDGSATPVECHYDKRYALDGVSLHPTWLPWVSISSADDQIDFNLRLMTDDWQFERGSYTYLIGDPVHFEVSVVMGNHMPLRVYVDHCVATATPDAEATLRYDFIEHNGCLADALLTNSTSRFLPRVEERSLRFQLDAFRFHQEPSDQVYISCYLKAVPVMSTVSSRNRACSFIDNRWRSADGDDQLCRSCDVSRWVEEPPATQPPETTANAKAWSTMTAEVMAVQDIPKHTVNFLRVRPGKQQGEHKPPGSSARLTERMSDYKAETTVHLGPLIFLPSSKFDTYFNN